MTRSVKEWIGKNDEAAVPDRVRARLFLLMGGHCSVCTRRISSGMAWQLDHIIALINGGQHRESNLQVLCGDCHKGKTATDSAIKAKTYAIRKRHLGLTKPKGRPMPGSKRSAWKHKIGGGWERR